MDLALEQDLDRQAALNSGVGVDGLSPSLLVNWPSVQPLLWLMLERAASHDAFQTEYQNTPISQGNPFGDLTYWVLRQPDLIHFGAIDPSLGKKGTIPFFSGVLQHADETLIQQGEGKGLAIYTELERDGHAFAMLEKRKKRLTGRDWTVEAGDVSQPAGIGYGWDYMPGDLWERGLVPSALMDEADILVPDGPRVVQIDRPSPITSLAQIARPFVAMKMAEGLDVEAYVNAFLEPFGAEIGKAVLWTDASGTRIPISDAFFWDRAGNLKIEKRGRAPLARLMAETLLDPDEIWIGVAGKKDPMNSARVEYFVDRRYIRISPDQKIMAVLQIGRKWWDAMTVHPIGKGGKASDWSSIQLRRVGKLIWKRKDDQG